MSNKGDSRESSEVRNTCFENVWNYCPSDIPMESMELPASIEKVSPPTDGQSTATKPTTITGTNQLKLNLPEPKWNFTNAVNELKKEKLNRFNIQNFTEEDEDFDYNAKCMKRIKVGDLLNQSKEILRTDKVMIGMKAFCEREIKHDTTSTHHDDKSTDEEFMIGRLTKSERAAKVKKYLEKKRRRKWNKQVNYESRKKVADTRPRYKGRFLSSEQALELANELRIDQKNKLNKAKIFVVEIFNKKKEKVVKRIYPTEEALRKYSSRNLF